MYFAEELIVYFTLNYPLIISSLEKGNFSFFMEKMTFVLKNYTTTQIPNIIV